eukprot:GHRQ01016470.1.p1 GENE.GHRQ01016470.1~~GHRQ01016470.1.p1  ORF type:complete len:139 (-),score=21.18 GHRQ01016470.1:46-462(-)
MGLHDLPADVYVDIAPLLHHVLLKLCQALDGCPGRHSAVPLPGQQLVPQLALTLHVAAVEEFGECRVQLLYSALSSILHGLSSLLGDTLCGSSVACCSSITTSSSRPAARWWLTADTQKLVTSTAAVSAPRAACHSIL